MQAWEWTTLIREGARRNANPWGAPAFSAFFFAITGFHGSRVASGVVILIVTAWNAARGRNGPEGVELAGLYWHFVDLVWVFVFGCSCLLWELLMTEPHAETGYRGYWAAWLVLLVVTLAMILTTHKALILGGIAVKSCIIGAWFMHLRHEKAGLVWSVVVGGLFFALFLFFLLSFDFTKGA
jgi:hypothetical protein